MSYKDTHSSSLRGSRKDAKGPRLVRKFGASCKITHLCDLAPWRAKGKIVTLAGGIVALSVLSLLPIEARAAENGSKLNGVINTDENRNSVKSLRDAVEFMIEKYGADYPKGKSYLNRLAKISDASSKEYKELQREALLNHPHVKGYNWLVEVRDQYWGNHGPINTMFQNGDTHYGGGGIHSWRTKGGRLETIAINDKGIVTKKKVLVDEPKGICRDAVVNFDGTKILFSMRKDKTDDYHLYEMKTNGSDLKQLIFGKMISDVDPVYLPDGKILFSSTRDPKFCQCNRHISNNLFTMNADGSNIIQISRNDLADFHSSLMPDGRILYSRWEYVDRHFGPSLGLWTTNPDGTMHQLFMGNNAWSPGFIGDARVIPGTDKVLGVYGACHDLPWGAMVVLDRQRGMEGPEPVVAMWPESGRKFISPDDNKYNRSLKNRYAVDLYKKLETRYEDPYPIHDVANGDGGGEFFMVSKVVGPLKNKYGRKKGNVGKTAIMLADVFGNEIKVYEIDDPVLGAYGALPISKRKRPPAVPNRVDLTKDYGTLYVNNVYEGTGYEMKNVKPGSIKYLRLIEAPPRRTWNEGQIWKIDASQVSAMNWNLTNNKRILGDVPVEEDGSAHFNVPADMFFQIHALDENKRMIQAMRSGTTVRPGETQGCIGCHENRLSAPAIKNRVSLAMRRAPSEITPWLDTPSVKEAKPFNYLTEVQPVWDKHCVECHDYGKKAGKKLNLSGDLSYPFNVSYTEIMHHSGPRYTGDKEKLVNFVGDGPPGVLPAYSWGSTRSKLVRMLKKGHKKVKLSKDELERVISWIDVNAVYYGRYESYYPGRNPILALKGGKKMEKKVFAPYDNHGGRKRIIAKGHLYNFTRPEKSPILKLFKDDKRRNVALEKIREAGELLKDTPREDQTNSPVAQSKIDKHNAARLISNKNEVQKSIEAEINGSKYYPYKSTK